MAITKKIRFEVFKRDSFTCQYCGRMAPDVLLEADHIIPRSKGGSDDLLNLIASCTDCNRGKSDSALSDTSVLAKRQKQLADLQERKEQLEMMFEWQKSLMNLEGEAVSKVEDFWSEIVPGNKLTEFGKKQIAKLIKRFGIADVLEAMRTMATHYDLTTDANINKAFAKIGGICQLKKVDPETREMFYIRGILRNRNYVNESYCLPLIRTAISHGADVDKLKQLAREVKSWTRWRETLEQFINDQNKEKDKDG